MISIAATSFAETPVPLNSKIVGTSFDAGEAQAAATNIMRRNDPLTRWWRWALRTNSLLRNEL